MTEGQRALLEAVAGHIDRFGYSPSHKELMAATGASSTSVVAYRLTGLLELGMVTLVRGQSRTVRVTVRGRMALVGALRRVS